MTQKMPIAVVAMKMLLNQGSVPGDSIKSSILIHMYNMHAQIQHSTILALYICNML